MSKCSICTFVHYAITNNSHTDVRSVMYCAVLSGSKWTTGRTGSSRMEHPTFR